MNTFTSRSHLQKGLFKKRALACLARPERQIALAQVFSDAGMDVTFALDRADCLRLAVQELPHFVLCDSELRDGSAGDVLDGLRNLPLFATIPVVALATRRTKDEGARLAQKSFAEVLTEDLTAPTLQKLATRLDELLPIAKRGVSPYLHLAPDGDPRSLVSESVEAEVLGILNQQLVVATAAELDLSSCVELKPRRTSPVAPIELSAGITQKTKAGYLHLFPLHRAQGPGRAWALALGKIGSAVTQTGPSVLVADPQAASAAALADVLTRYGVGATAISLEDMDRSSDEILRNHQVLIFTEMDASVAKRTWRGAWQKISEAERPTVISLTTSLAPKSQPKLQFLQKPVPLGRLLDTIETVSTQASAVLGQCRPSERPQPYPVVYGTTGALIGVDEAAAYLEFPRMIQRGTRLELGSPLLEDVWQGASTAVVSLSVPSSRPGFWQSRVEPVNQALLSKSKRYERVTKSLKRSNNDAA